MRAHAQLDAAREKSSRGYQQLAVDADQLRQQLEKAYNEKPIDTYIRKCDELAKKLVEGKINANQYKEQTERLADGLKTVGEQHSGAFGSHAVAEMGNYIAGLFTMERGIEAVVDALRAQREERARLAEEDRGALTAIGQLSAVGGTPADLEFARKLQAEGLIENEAAAATATKGVVSARLTDKERAYALSLAESRRIDPQQIGEFSIGVKGFQERFGKQAGSFEDVSKEIISAARITKQSPEEIAAGMSKLAATAQDEGVSPERALAIYTTFARSAYSRKQAIPESEKIIKGEADFSPEMAQVYAEQLRAIQGARGAELGTTLQDIDPRSSAAVQAARAKGRRKEYVASTESTTENLYQSVTEEGATLERKEGGWFDEWLYRRLSGMLGMGQESQEKQLRDIAVDPQSRSRYSEELLSKIDAHLARQNEMIERNNRQLSVPSGRQE